MTNAEINANRRVNRQLEYKIEKEFTKEQWKEKAYHLAKAYGDSLKHLNEHKTKVKNLESFIERLKADNRILIDIIRIKEL